MDEESRRPATPPHHPTYNVHLDMRQIKHIVTSSLPSSRLLQVEPLSSGGSFNNRIYFLTISSDEESLRAIDLTLVPTRQVTDQDELELKAVLKVSGQFFGPDKVENEVACLYLMEKYCPDVPVPRVIAWSSDTVVYQKILRRTDTDGDGQETRRFTVVRSGDVHQGETPLQQASSHRPTRAWILMSRRPGRPLRPEENFDHSQHDGLMRQLAGFMKKWRTDIPFTSQSFGNTRLRVVHPSSQDGGQEGHLSIEVQGLLLCHYGAKEPILSKVSYFRHRLEDSLSKLENEDIYASPKRAEISQLVRNWMDTDLNRLSLLTSAPPTGFDQSPRFTHYDLSPRNILVSPVEAGSLLSHLSQLQITGVVDFEFAGFFPEEEEFTNTSVANEGDWPARSYNILLEELERLGMRTPRKKKGAQGRVEEKQWKEACLLCGLIEDVAPWYLREGGVKGGDLEEELRNAAARVERLIRDLQDSMK